MSDDEANPDGSFHADCRRIARAALGLSKNERVSAETWKGAVAVAERLVPMLSVRYTQDDVTRIFAAVLESAHEHLVPRASHEELLAAVVDFHGTKSFPTESPKVTRIKAAADSLRLHGHEAHRAILMTLAEAFKRELERIHTTPGDSR